MPKRIQILIAAFTAVGALSTVSAQTVDSRIRLNSVGFLPGFPKQATIAAEFTKFWVYAAPDGTSPVYTGTASAATDNTDTNEKGLMIADFSGFDTPGRYYIRVNNAENNGVGKSPEFTIGGNVFVEPFRAAMLGFYLWRCGAAVSASYNGKSYSHAACHTKDGDLRYYTPDGGAGTKDGTGGWHDAGDYNKYTVNSGAAVAFTLKAWEHFWHVIETTPLVSVSNSGALPAYLAEVKWNLDWVSKMQFPDGRVSHKLSTLNFGGEIMPDKESDTRYYAPWNTMATASFVGQMAIAARIYKPYDKAFADKCLEQARLSYKTLMDTGFVGHTQAPFVTGEYGGNDDSDKRLWAAAEMWETTGESEFLEYLETYMSTSVGSQITWSNVTPISALTYLNSMRAGRNREKMDRIRENLISTADRLIDFANNHAYARNISLYNWGANGTLAGTAYALHSAYLQTGDPKYRHAVQDVAAHLLGRNYYGRSFVTGVGYDPPKNPHDRTSTASKTPWPGRLIGGPHNSKNGAPANITQCATSATCWFDVSADYWTNEVAINWNAPLAYALAALMPGAETYPARQYPGQPGENVSAKHAAAPKKALSKAAVTRVVRTRGERLDIPAGSKAYGLDGRLIARKKSANDKAFIGRNGVFLIKAADY